MNDQRLFSWVFRLGLTTLFLVGCNGVQPPAPGETRIDPWEIEQVWVPAGPFLMGTGADELGSLESISWARYKLESEQPQHEVRLTHGYWIDKYEVTNAAFQAFVEDGGYLKEEYWSEEGWQWLSEQNVERLPRECVYTTKQAERSK